MHMPRIYLLIALCLATYCSTAQIKVSDNHKFLTTQDGKPFFWLGDTDWELFHRLTREEAEEFLEIRKQQGFNVIHAVALAEFEGLRKPNRYNDLPLVDLDPAKLDITPGSNPSNASEYDYWDHVDFIINKAAEKGMYIGLLPTWGDKVAHLWGDGPIVFNPQSPSGGPAFNGGRRITPGPVARASPPPWPPSRRPRAASRLTLAG